jgi:hypothetical protein
MEIAVSAVLASVKPAKRLFSPLDSALNTVGQSDDAIDMILTMVPTAAYKTLVLFEKHGEIIADNLSKAGWSWGCISTVNSKGQTIFVADAHRGDGKRFVVRADEKLTAFLELESGLQQIALTSWRNSRQTGRR